MASFCHRRLRVFKSQAFPLHYVLQSDVVTSRCPDVSAVPSQYRDIITIILIAPRVYNMRAAVYCKNLLFDEWTGMASRSHYCMQQPVDWRGRAGVHGILLSWINLWTKQHSWGCCVCDVLCRIGARLLCCWTTALTECCGPRSILGSASSV